MAVKHASPDYWRGLSDKEKTLACIKEGDTGITDLITPIQSTLKDSRAWEELCARITLNGPMATRFEVDHDTLRRLTLVVLTMRTLHRDAAYVPFWNKARPGVPHQIIPEMMNVKVHTVRTERILLQAQPPTLRPTDPPATSLRWLRAFVREAWLHELDEFLLVDGNRVFDPHADELADVEADQLIIDDPFAMKEYK